MYKLGNPCYASFLVANRELLLPRKPIALGEPPRSIGVKLSAAEERPACLRRSGRREAMARPGGRKRVRWKRRRKTLKRFDSAMKMGAGCRFSATGGSRNADVATRSARPGPVRSRNDRRAPATHRLGAPSNAAVGAEFRGDAKRGRNPLKSLEGDAKFALKRC